MSEIEKGMIIEKYNTGKSISKISRETNRSRCVIRNFLVNPEKYGTKKPSVRKKSFPHV